MAIHKIPRDSFCSATTPSKTKGKRKFVESARRAPPSNSEVNSWLTCGGKYIKN